MAKTARDVMTGGAECIDENDPRRPTTTLRWATPTSIPTRMPDLRCTRGAMRRE